MNKKWQLQQYKIGNTQIIKLNMWNTITLFITIMD
jgi:hypothetical protein